MDFHTMKRKELQSLCKQHKIPANLTNLEMANRLASLLKIDEEKPKEQRLKKSCLKILDDFGDIDEKDSEDKEGKRVRFSPVDQTFVFEKTNPRAMRLARRKSMVVAEDEIDDLLKVSEVKDVGESVAVDDQVQSLRTRGRGRKPGQANAVEAKLLPKKKAEESWNSDVVDCEVQPLVDAQREKAMKNTASEAKPVTRRSARSVDERPADSAAWTEQVENVELPRRKARSECAVNQNVEKAPTRCSRMNSAKDSSGKGIEEVKEQVNEKSRATRSTRQKKGDIGLNEPVSAAESAVAVVDKVSTRCLRRNNTSKDTGGKAIEEGNEKVRVARTTRQKKGEIGLNETVSAAESAASVVEKASTRGSRRNASKDACGKTIETAKEEGNEKVRALRTTRQPKGDIGLNETASAAESAAVADQCLQRRSTRVAIKRGSLAPGELNAKQSDADVQERGVLMRSKQLRSQGNSGRPGKSNEQASCAANKKLSTAKHAVDLQTDVEAAQLVKSIDSVKNFQDEDLLDSVCEAADTQNKLCNDSGAKHADDLQTDAEAAKLVKCIDSVKISEDEDLFNLDCETADSNANHAEDLQFNVEAAQPVKPIDTVNNFEAENLPTSVCVAADIQKRPCNESGSIEDDQDNNQPLHQTTPLTLLWKECELRNAEGEPELANESSTKKNASMMQPENAVFSSDEESIFIQLYKSDDETTIGYDKEEEHREAEIVNGVSSEDAEIVLLPSGGFQSSPLSATSTVSKSLSEDSRTELGNSITKADSYVQSDSSLTSSSIDKCTGLSVPASEHGLKGIYHAQHEIECEPTNSGEGPSIKNIELEGHTLCVETISSNEQVQLTRTSGSVDSTTAKDNQSGDALFIAKEENTIYDFFNPEDQISKDESIPGFEFHPLLNESQSWMDILTVSPETSTVVSKEPVNPEADKYFDHIGPYESDINMGPIQEDEGVTTAPMIGEISEGIETYISDKSAECKTSQKQGLVEESDSPLTIHRQIYGISSLFKLDNVEQDSAVIINRLEGITTVSDVQLNDNHEDDAVLSDQNLEVYEEKAGKNVGYERLDAGVTPTATVDSQLAIHAESERSHKQGLEEESDSQLAIHEDAFEIASLFQLENDEMDSEETHWIASLFTVDNAESDSVAICNELEVRNIAEVSDAHLNGNHEDANLANQNMKVHERKDYNDKLPAKQSNLSLEEEAFMDEAGESELQNLSEVYIGGTDKHTTLQQVAVEPISMYHSGHMDQSESDSGISDEDDECSEQKYAVTSNANLLVPCGLVCSDFSNTMYYDITQEVNGKVSPPEATLDAVAPPEPYVSHPMHQDEYENNVKYEAAPNILEGSEENLVLPSSMEDETAGDENAKCDDSRATLEAISPSLEALEEGSDEEKSEEEETEEEKTEEEKTEEEGYENNDKNVAAPIVLEEGSEEKLVLPNSVENASTSDGSAEYGDGRETVEAERNVLEVGSEEKFVLSSSVDEANTSDGSAEYENNDKNEAAPNVLDEGLKEKLVLPSDGSSEYDDARETVVAIGISQEARCCVEELDSTKHAESKEDILELVNLERISEKTVEQGRREILGEIANTAENSVLHDTNDEENFSLTLEPAVDDQKGCKEAQIHNGVSEDSQNVLPCAGGLIGSPLKEAEGLTSTAKVYEMLEVLGDESFTSDRIDDNAGSEESHEQGLTKDSSLQPSGHPDTHCGNLAEESTHSPVLVHESTDTRDIELTSYEIALFMGDDILSDKSGTLEYWISETSLLTSVTDGSENNEEKIDMEQALGDEVYKQGFESSEDTLFDSVKCDKVDAAQCRIIEVVTGAIDRVLEGITNADVLKDSKQECLIRSAVETNFTDVNMERDDLGGSVKLLTPFPKPSHFVEEMDATKQTCAEEDIHIHENGENKEFELAGQETDDDAFICEAEDPNHATSETGLPTSGKDARDMEEGMISTEQLATKEIKQDSDLDGFAVQSSLVSASELQEEATVPNSLSQAICQVEYEDTSISEHCGTYKEVSELIEDCKIVEEITPDVQDEDLSKGEHDDTSHQECCTEELEVQPSVPHPEMSVTMRDDQYKSAHVKVISKEGEITPQLKTKAEKSSRIPASATNQKKRSILIHGTPRRPIKTADMKENSTAQFKRDPLANATAMKPLAGRKALGELSRWRP